jgi:hypothetical protein
MAKRKTTTKKLAGGTNLVVLDGGTKSPTRRRRSGGGGGKKKARRRSSGGGGAGYSMKNRMIAGGVGGLGVGLIEKHFGAQLPSIPFLGKKGAIAAGIYFSGTKNKILQDVAVAAMTLAGYEYGRLGVVSGVEGVTAQL